MEKLKIGQIMNHHQLVTLITARTDIFGTTYVLCVVPGDQQYVSWRVSGEDKLEGGVYYSASAFHMAYEEYLSRF